MLTALRKETKEKVIATVVDRSHGPFICANCGNEAGIRKGKSKIHHFYHKVTCNCTAHEGESKEHLFCKISIYNSFISKGYTAHLEHPLDGIRPDIIVWINGQWVGIEVQRTDLSDEQLLERSNRYRMLGIPVIWILVKLPETDKHSTGIYPTVWSKDWIETLQTLNNGCVFYWVGETNVQIIKFYSRYNWIEPNDFGGGGYSKPTPRKRKLIFYSVVDILTMGRFSNQNKYGSVLFWGFPQGLTFGPIPKDDLTDNLPDYIRSFHM